MAAVPPGPTQSPDMPSASRVSFDRPGWSVRIVNTLSLLGRIVLALFVFTVAQSFFWAGHVPLVLKLAVGAVGCFAYVRPGGALLVVAGLTPLMRMFGTRILTDAYPARVTEALVLAFLAGWLLGRLRPVSDSTPAPSAIRIPALLFGVTVATSCVVHLTALQISKDYPWSFVSFFTEYLATAYLTAPIPDPRPWVEALSGYEFIVSAATILEGLGLFLAVITLCRRNSTLAHRLVQMVVVGAVGVATLSIVELTTAAISSGDPAGALPALLQQRWAVFINKVNSAGSYLILVLPIALALAAHGKHRVRWLAASVLIGISLWLSGSRTVLLISLALLLASAGWLGTVYQRGSTRRSLGRAAVAVGAVLIVALIGYRLVAFADSGPLDSLRIRWLFVETTFRMLASSPWLGVGVGQYRAAAEFMNSQELQELLIAAFSSRLENPHNYFLLIVAELGVIGLGLFLWLLTSSLKHVWRVVRVHGVRSIASGVGIGLVACCATLLVNHSLVYAEVAYSFWLTLGLAVALTDSMASSNKISAQGRHRAVLSRWVIPTVLIVVVGSGPIRAGHERSKINLSRISYGFHNWELEGTERRVRWTGRRATFFVQPNIRQVQIPLRALRVQPEWVFTVDIRLDNRLAQRITLEDEVWHDVTLKLPPRDPSDESAATTTIIMESAVRPGTSWLGPISGHTVSGATGPATKLGDGTYYPRIDLVVSPGWRPADELPGSTDRRELGIKVGEITLQEAR